MYRYINHFLGTYGGWFCGRRGNERERERERIHVLMCFVARGRKYTMNFATQDRPKEKRNVDGVVLLGAAAEVLKTEREEVVEYDQIM